MLQLLSIGGYVFLLLGIISILIAFISYKRKGEAEISQSLIEIPLFRFGVAIILLGLVIKLLF